METIGQILGFMLTALFCLLGLAMFAVAWTGLTSEISWQWAAGVIIASFVVRLYLPIAVGAFLFAHNIWGWPLPESVLFALPWLIFLSPSIAASVFSISSSAMVRR